MNWHEQAADILNKLPGVKLGSGSLDGVKVRRFTHINDIGEVHVVFAKELESAYEAGAASVKRPVPLPGPPPAKAGAKVKPLKASK